MLWRDREAVFLCVLMRVLFFKYERFGASLIHPTRPFAATAEATLNILTLKRWIAAKQGGSARSLLAAAATERPPVHVRFSSGSTNRASVATGTRGGMHTSRTYSWIFCSLLLAPGADKSTDSAWTYVMGAASSLYLRVLPHKFLTTISRCASPGAILLWKLIQKF